MSSGWQFFKYIWNNGDRIFNDLYHEFRVSEEQKRRMTETTKVLALQVAAERKNFEEACKKVEESNKKLNDLHKVVGVNINLKPEDIKDVPPAPVAESGNWMDRFYTKEEQEEFKRSESYKKSERFKNAIRQANEDRENTKKVTEEGWMDKLIEKEIPRETAEERARRILRSKGAE